MKNLTILLLWLASVNLVAQGFSDLVKNERIESGDDVTWEQFGPGNSGFVNLLRYHPTLPDICYTSPDLFEAYQTEDNGTSWKTVRDVDDSGDRRMARLYDLFYSSKDPAFGIAIEFSRLHTSQDTGRSWQVVHNCPWYDTHGGVTDESRHWFQKVSAVALDPSDDNTWYVGAGNFPRGQQQLAWTSIANPTAATPRGQDSRYMGTIWKTTNAGQSWTTLTNGIHPQAQFSRIIVHPENGDLIFAASQYGLFRSVDGGASWVNIGEGRLDNNTIMNMDHYYDATRSKFTLYVADQVRYYSDGQSTRSDGGIFKSEDNGATWTNINGNLGLDINRLSGGVPGNYYQYIAKWFGISEASARATYPVLPQNALQYFNSLNVDPSQENTLYVGFHDAQIQNSIIPGRLWKTTDGGQNWISVARDFGPAWEADRDYWEERGNPISDNMAMGHQPSNQQFGQNYPLRSLRYCSVNSRGDIMILYAHNTLVSTDGGDSWQQVDEDYTPNGNIMGRGNSNLPGECLYMDKRLGEGIGYFGSGEHHLWRSTNDGTDGRQAVTYLNGTQESVFSVVTHPWDVDIVFTTSMRQAKLDRIFRSNDGGETFVDWGKATEATEWMKTNHLRIDPVNPDFMYFGVTEVGGSGGGGGTDGPDADREGGFHKSSNGGRNFAPSNKGMPVNTWVRDIEFDPRDDTRASLFAACPWNAEKQTDGGLFFSDDRGENWTEIQVSNKIEGVNNIQFDHTGRLYATAGRRAAGLDNGGLFYSDDYGQTWTQIFDGPFVDNFAVSPFDHNVLIFSMSVLTKNPGIFVSLDRGQTWSKNNMAMGRPAGITQIEFDYYDPSRIWISVFGGGFYRGQFPAGADTRKITLSPGVADIARNETLQVVPALSDGVDERTLIYQSSNPSVASVSSDGIITGLSRGAARIYAISADGRYADFVQLTVDVANAPLTSVDIFPNRLELNEGETDSLKATTVPVFSDLATDIVWVSSDPAIATVDQNGVVTALTGGIAEISATAGAVKGTVSVFVITPNRSRFLTFENRSDFIPSGGTIPEMEAGKEVNLRFRYATEIVEGVVEDFNFLTVRVRQLDENGSQVNISPFNQVIPTSAPNTDDVVVTYSLPTTFQDGSPIPLTENLPAGHRLVIRPLMVSNGGAGQRFTGAQTDVIIKRASRSRFLTFENVRDFIPNDGTIPEVELEQELPIRIHYGTEVENTIEEDLRYVTIRVRQLDEAGNEVNISAFNETIPDGASNAADTTVTYTVPTTFADGTLIPITKDLPTGHRLHLNIVMASDDADGNRSFIEFDDLFIINKPGRTRFLDFVNVADYFVGGGTTPEVQEGQEMTIDISYATEVARSEEEDLRFVTIRVIQLNERGSQVNISPFNQAITDNAPNVADTTVTYTFPTAFQNGTPIPLTRDLPAGHRLILRILMVADDPDGNRSFTGFNSEIVLNPVAVTSVLISPEKSILEPGETATLTATITPANAANQQVSWTSSDERVATVDSSGVVTAIGGGQAIITITTNDGGFTATSFVHVQAPYLGTHPVPGVLEAENYDLGGSEVAYLDTTPGNSGGAYRTDDVDLVSTTDRNGGYHVTDIETGEWLAYTVEVATTDAYYLSFRVASNTEVAALSLQVDGVNETGTVNIPNTTGTWQTLAIPTPINLSAGAQALRVNIESGDFDLNYLELVAVPSSCIGVSDWLLGAVYNTGDEVRYNGLRYVAKYYTTSVPGSEAWELVGYCGAAYPDCYDVSEWSPTTTYTRSGTSIRYQGDLYISRWYVSAGQTPGVADVWEYVGPCSAASLDAAVSDCPSDFYAWNSSAIYRTAGAYVTYNGHLYVNLWYANAGEEPGVAAVWSLERPCNPVAISPTCPDVPIWEAKVYAAEGTEVLHNNGVYTNLWYAQSGDEPGVAAVWNYEGPCASATARMTSEVAGGFLLGDTSESFHYSLAPNPFSDQLTLRLVNNKQYDRVEMVDLLGRVVLSQSLSMDEAEVELSIGDEKLERGLYLIRLIGKEGVKVLKVRKN